MWQKIETAPKDGRQVIVCHAEYGKMAIASWCEVTWWCGVMSDWQDMGDLGWGGMCGVEPTHWMPLPAPPTERTTAE
jgi:hypothetical protein